MAIITFDNPAATYGVVRDGLFHEVEKCGDEYFIASSIGGWGNTEYSEYESFEITGAIVDLIDEECSDTNYQSYQGDPEIFPMEYLLPLEALRYRDDT